MKKYLILLMVLFIAAGCTGSSQEKKAVLAKINDYEITKDEFEQEFKDSVFSSIDTIESRKEFLDNLINRKLILQDAQAKNLDKKEDFLKMIESFWERSLLKLALDIKTKQIAGSSFVSDREIEEVYNKMLQDGKADKPYDQMYSQIKWEITRSKESEIMSDWVGNLRKKANIKVNYGLLGENK